MRKPVVVITGAGGEIGHGLIDRLAQRGDRRIVTIDVSRLDESIAKKVDREVTGSITDRPLLERLMAEFEVDLVFHLAALLSTRSEFTPIAAHEVNVEGTLSLLEFAQHEAESHGRPVVFVYPSSIAAYGLPDAATKASVDRVTEDQYLHPTTMYGCNKLYCELLGDYYARHYKQLAADNVAGRVDFRCVRFPGLISALTTPSGGTSDYAPEMIHAAAKGEPYACFVQARHADSVHGDAGRRGGALDAGVCAAGTAAADVVQRRRVQPVGSGDRRGRRAGVPGRPHDLDDRCQAPGDRRYMAGRRRRQRRAPRLGLRASIRLRARVQRVPDSDDQTPLRSLKRSTTAMIVPMPKLTVEGFDPIDVEEGKRLVLAIEQDVHVDILHACGGNARCTTCRVEFIEGAPQTMTAAEKHVLGARGLTGVRLSCQIVCDHDMHVRAISRLEGSGRPDPGPTPQPTVQPPPEWTQA